MAKKSTGLERKSFSTKLYYVLKPSPIDGIGVFTRRDLAKGTKLKLFDETDSRFIPFHKISDHLTLEYIERYGVKDGAGYWIAANLHKMSVGWYLNHSSAPNVYHDDAYNFFAIRDIKAGEELTIDYITLGEEKI